MRLTGAELSAVCRLDLYGSWRLLSVFESADRGVVLLIAEHTRDENPYRLIYEALGITEPAGPRTKPTCCDPGGKPPVDADLASRLEAGLSELARTQLSAGVKRRAK